MNALFALALLQDDTPTGASALGAVMGMGVLIVSCAFALLMISSLWKIFTKAGKPGWAAIIPIYSIYVLVQIVGAPMWWLVLLLLPILGSFVALPAILTTLISLMGLVFGLMTLYRLAKVFGHGFGFMLGLIFLPFIFYPILAFGKSMYRAPTGAMV